MHKYTIVIVLFLASTLGLAQEQRDTSQVNLPAVIVSAVREEQPVGPSHQPKWTTHRRFPSTRVYVQDLPNEAEFEQWLEIRVKRHGQLTETRFRQEMGFGVMKRMQLDLYQNTVHFRDGDNSVFTFRGWSGEVRYALADWGVLPGNPTLYFEYLYFNEGYDKIEPKLLLGGGLAPRWHWALNAIVERELAPLYDRDEEYAVNAAVGYTLADEQISLGPSFNFSTETERSGGAAERNDQYLLGFSVQWRPVERAYLDLEPLFGLTDESNAMRMFIVFGWQF